MQVDIPPETHRFEIDTEQMRCKSHVHEQEDEEHEHVHVHEREGSSDSSDGSGERYVDKQGNVLRCSNAKLSWHSNRPKCSVCGTYARPGILMCVYACVHARTHAESAGLRTAHSATMTSNKRAIPSGPQWRSCLAPIATGSLSSSKLAAVLSCQQFVAIRKV